MIRYEVLIGKRRLYHSSESASAALDDYLAAEEEVFDTRPHEGYDGQVTAQKRIGDTTIPMQFFELLNSAKEEEAER